MSYDVLNATRIFYNIVYKDVRLTFINKYPLEHSCVLIYNRVKIWQAEIVWCYYADQF